MRLPDSQMDGTYVKAYSSRHVSKMPFALTSEACCASTDSGCSLGLNDQFSGCLPASRRQQDRGWPLERREIDGRKIQISERPWCTRLPDHPREPVAVLDGGGQPAG